MKKVQKKKKANKSSKARKPKKVPFLRSPEWKQLREDVLKRDNHKCVICGATENLSVHHILPRRGWNDLKLEEQDLVTLCCRHHTFGPCSCHRGIGYILLMEWLKANRPAQYQWIMDHL